MKLPRAVLSAAAFVALGLVIHVGLAVAYNEGVASQTVDALMRQHFEENEDPVRVVMLGASQSRGGFDTRLTDGAFTYAFPNEGYSMYYYHLLRVLEQHPEVEHVIAPTGPYYFSDRGEPYPEEWIGFREAVRYGEAGGDPWGYLKDAFHRHLFPYAGKHQMTWDFLTGGRQRSSRNAMIRGFQPNYSSMDAARMAQSAETVVGTHYTGATDPIHARYLERIAELCAERGLRLTLVEWPLTAEYIRLAETRGMTEQGAVEEAAIEAARAHLPITFVNLREVFKDRRELFGNSDHVNAQGAYLATRMLLERAGLPIREDVTGPLPPPRHHPGHATDGLPVEALQ
jgi:hypothetical protein